MAESFAQRRNAVNRALRQVRKSYRVADTQGELLERELDRLILRKTIVSPESLRAVLSRYEAYTRAAQDIQRSLTAAVSLATGYA
jgi:hypothetical protein